MLRLFFETLTKEEEFNVLKTCEVKKNTNFTFDGNGGVYFTDIKDNQRYLSTEQIFERLDENIKKCWREEGFII